jgi:hypothetical protein
MSSIITIISLLFLLASFSVQAISDDPHYNVIFRQQGLENSNVIYRIARAVVISRLFILSN